MFRIGNAKSWQTFQELPQKFWFAPASAAVCQPCNYPVGYLPRKL